MSKLPFDRSLSLLETESLRFRDVLVDCDPAARVPACPARDAADLLWHLGEVQGDSGSGYASLCARHPGLFNRMVAYTDGTVLCGRSPR